MQSAYEFESARKEAKKKKRASKKLTKEEKQLRKIQRTVDKLGDPDELDRIKAMRLPELKTRVNNCELNIAEAKLEFHKNHGAEEQRLVDALKELRQPLNDAINYQTALKDFAILQQKLLEEED